MCAKIPEKYYDFLPPVWFFVNIIFILIFLWNGGQALF
jgi:hypothetical protein